MRRASRTVARLIRVWVTSSRSDGSVTPSANWPLRMRSRSSWARTSEAFGTDIGPSSTGDRSPVTSATVSTGGFIGTLLPLMG